MTIAAGMNDHTFTVLVTILGAAATGVLAVFGVWLGASLALRGQRRVAREERERAALSYIQRCVVAALRATGDPERYNVQDAGEALKFQMLQPQEVDVPRSIVDALVNAAFALRDMPDDDPQEVERMEDYLTDMGGAIDAALNGQAYTVPTWSKRTDPIA
jgi:hypothetical protein